MVEANHTLHLAQLRARLFATSRLLKKSFCEAVGV
jgi:hypothetical protein